MKRRRRPRKIKGTFCEVKLEPKSAFDPRSFRWKTTKRGKARLLVGCPKGSYTKKRCLVGLRAHVLLTPTLGERCPVGTLRVKK